MEEIMIFWMVLLILCIGIEVLTLGLTTIWFAAGALVAIFSALLQAPIYIQVILFLVVSLVSLFFTRPIAVKYFNKDRVKTNVESMVGRQAIVTGEIDNLQAMGQVTVSGQEWSARSWDDRVKIPTGTVVVVAAISGVKLIVRTEQQFDDKVRANQEAYGSESVPGVERMPVDDKALEGKAAEDETAERKPVDDKTIEREAAEDETAERKPVDDKTMEREAAEDETAERKPTDDESMEQKAGKWSPEADEEDPYQ